MLEDLQGRKYGKYTIIKRCAHPKGQKVLAVCECGRERVLFLGGVKLNTKGCPRCSRLSMTGVGFKARHGMCKTKIYRTWQKMLNRCTNPNNKRYESYGGRGIAVCDSWKTFENFYNDMGDKPTPRHSLDRIDNDGDYCKENCRWATPVQQYRNRRSNVFVSVNGVRMIFSDATKALNISQSAVRFFMKTRHIKDPQEGIQRFLSR